MNIGYMRVSTFLQNQELQSDALKKAGCEKIFLDKMSGSKFDRPELKEALTYVRPGDTLVVWKLDRLGRSLKDLIQTVILLEERGIHFMSLTENINTTTPSGKLIFHIMGALAEFERDLIRERTSAGLEAARSRGRKGGRPKKINTSKIAMVKQLYAEKKNTVQEICQSLGIKRATFYRYLKQEEGA